MCSFAPVLCLPTGGFVYFDTLDIPALTWLASGPVVPPASPGGSSHYCLSFWFTAILPPNGGDDREEEEASLSVKMYMMRTTF